MLAKVAETIPPEGDVLYEPKWDGFRAIVFRSKGDAYIQSRDSRPLDRYFPELHDALIDRLPDDCVVDGEIVIAGPSGLDFDALQMRLHPAASRVAKLAKEMPSSFVAFDLLAADGKSVMEKPLEERRAALERLLAKAKSPLFLTPMTRVPAGATMPFHESESKPATPDSATVGSSGISANRRKVETARSFTFPVFVCGSTSAGT